ncbi:Arylsulfatase I [Merluccius polli]|uniref:Arylsulfatase I n=1 Tax=Merluccius polli TaxID=89951 RepID=A0AA47MQ69_MERPO|nr:Arylsulfatase I [Merluccius polli]
MFIILDVFYRSGSSKVTRLCEQTQTKKQILEERERDAASERPGAGSFWTACVSARQDGRVLPGPTGSYRVLPGLHAGPWLPGSVKERPVSIVSMFLRSAWLAVLSGLLSLGLPSADWTVGNRVEDEGEGRQNDQATPDPKKPPHIIFILTDDQGYNDIGYHNPSIRTPTLDRLAAEGVRLENYYVQPICTPSRSQLLTGRYQIHTGLQHSIIRPRQPSCLPPRLHTLPQRLQQAGYATHMLGKWHLGFYRKACLPTRKGFDTFFGSLTGSVDYYSYGSCDGPGLCGYDLHDNESVAWGQQGRYSTLLYTQRARKILEGHDPTAQPLFLLLSLQAVHTPLQPPKSYIYPYRHMYNVARRKYAAMVSLVDEAVHNVTYALRKLGYYRNSVIVFSTDNGAQPFTGGSNWPLRGRKGTYWEGGVRGVAFVHSPLLKRRRRVSKALLHITDWFPTLLGLARANSSQSEGLDGFDVWPTLSEGKESPRQEILHNIDPLHKPPSPPGPRPGSGKVSFKKGLKGTPKQVNRLTAASLPKKKKKKKKKKTPKPRRRSRDARVFKPLSRKRKLKSKKHQGGSKAQVYPLLRDTTNDQNHLDPGPGPGTKPNAHTKSRLSSSQTAAATRYHYQSHAQPRPTQATSHNNTNDPPVTRQQQPPGATATLQWSQHIWDTSVQAAIRVGDWKLLTGDPGHGDWVPPQTLSSLPGRWWDLERTFTPSSASKTTANQNIWLFNISGDPYERWDVSAQRPDVVQALLERLAFHNRTAVPVFFPPDDPRADPALRGGAWGPWVEEEEGEEGRGVEEEQERYRGVYKRRERKEKQMSKLNAYFLKLNEQLTSSLV